MNYYERIQRSIDYIEEGLCEDLSPEMCAEQAFMSVSGYYRMFFSVAGMTVKEYIRGRRLTCAYKDLRNTHNVTDVAFRYGFSSTDGFSRSFQKQFGILPSKVKSAPPCPEILMLERMNIMDVFFENNELVDKYPDIKVIKDLEPMKVACFSYYGKCPENHAYEVLKRWFHENEIILHDFNYRLFGYNNPDPQGEQEEYAYEYCITIPDEIYEKLEDVPSDLYGQTYPKVYRKLLSGGKYAVMSVKPGESGLGEQIMKAWPRFTKWLDESKYMWGQAQYLEEHLGFSPEDDHISGVDLYISIAADTERKHYLSQAKTLAFRNTFTKEHRPELSDLDTFWKSGESHLFQSFAETVLQKFDLRFGIPVWSNVHGWTYRLGKSGVCLISGILIAENGFILKDILVHDEASLTQALQAVEAIYQEQKEAFLAKISEKNARQAERSRKREQREREEKQAIEERIVPDKYNVFHWPQKLDVAKLNRLYQLDARGLCDETLVDEVGLLLYMRCKYGKEDMECMERYHIRCHNCGKELSGDNDFRECSCGYQYSYREYRRSYRRNNMPTGAASRVFEEYLRKWSAARGYQEKMILIDTLLHEFHLSLVSGAVHRPVAMNFIDGSRKQVEEIVEKLAR
ncbi:MAG: helix-turn-helix domain-containing protein [Lachnospiraceae bacterium]|nr:helix-turn-helix domain-containing protein [Lachnospiraceae bacterium]